MGLTILLGKVYGQCRNGWIKYNESCYLFAGMLSDWGEAEVLCISLYGAYLAEIETGDENNFIKQEAKINFASAPKGSGYWIGGSDVEVEGVFKWVKSDHRFQFTDWAIGNPRDSGHYEDCVHLIPSVNFRWNDVSCSAQAYYICEKPVTNPNAEIIG